MANDAAGMRGIRSRNTDGQLRDKRDDTHVGTIEIKQAFKKIKGGDSIQAVKAQSLKLF